MNNDDYGGKEAHTAYAHPLGVCSFRIWTFA